MVSRSKSRKLRLIKSNSASNTGSFPTDSSGSEPPGRLKLDDLMRLARDAFEAQDWAGLLVLSGHAPSEIQEFDRAEASTWLLGIRVWALVQNGAIRVHSLSKEARADLIQALQHLANTLVDFHSSPEFALYLDAMCGPWEYMPDVIRHLERACRCAPTSYRLGLLREQLFRLAMYPADEFIPARDAVLAHFPKPLEVLQGVYDALDLHSELDPDVQRFVTVGQLELEAYNAEPWDLPDIAAKIRTIPSPSAEAIVQRTVADKRFSNQAPLTPDAWAFMVELRHTPVEQLAPLLLRYPASFGCLPCDGLRAIAAGLVEPDYTRADVLLVRGAEMLVEHVQAGGVWFGTNVAIQATNGIEECDVGYQSLYLTNDIDTLLLQFFEQVPESDRNNDMLGAFYYAYMALADGSQIEPNESVHYGPGLYCLSEGSVALQLALSNVHPEFHERLEGLMEGLARTVEEGVPLPRYYYSAIGDSEPVSAADARGLLDGLGRLAEVRGDLEPRAVENWRTVVGMIFGELFKLEGETRLRTVQLARQFEADLLVASGAFRLGYMEQISGDKTRALQHYLAELEASDKEEMAVINNVKLLWLKNEDLAAVSRMVALLEQAQSAHRRKDATQKLLKDAKAQKTALEHDDQFQRTAVNRWPSLTQPARKLLGVLATIQRYSGFEELGRYAGMDEVWVSRHYSKLVETGMILHPKGGGYTINPHIKPLIEKESQHAVVGRIVRAQGTSAVKQVFNSQREFTIYQVMMQLCPNQLVFPNCSLQSIMSFDRMKSLVDDDDFNYYLRAGVDIVVVSSTTYLPLLAIEVDSAWHETEKQQRNDVKKDRLFAAAGIPFMRLQPVGTPSEGTIRAQVAEHLDDLVRALRTDLPGYDQARGLLNDLSTVTA